MDIVKALSRQRLETYRCLAVETDQRVLDRYLWNVAISEALYMALHFLEIALRNHVHDVIALGSNDADWLVHGRFLDPREKTLVAKAVNNLNHQHKDLSAGNAIAELNFGFWTSLFDVRYERILWQKWIKEVFPSMPRRLRTRHIILGRLNKIRKLRNRVFHYEPIWHLNNLYQQHDEILQTINWISPELEKLVHSKNRFPEVFLQRP